MTDSTPAIHVVGLRKSYGRNRALDGLDLTVRVGEIAGFLGPNGSGKSTTISILLGLLRSDGGVARLFGGDPWHDAVELHRRVAYVPGDVNLWPNLTGGEAIDIIARLRGGIATSRRNDLLGRFDLDPTKKVRAYSKGNRQKVALVAALASDAELLIMDEPTSGLDPLMEATFTDCVREIKQQGRSALLSSHIFSEVESVCDTVTIIRDGKTVEAGTLSELRYLRSTTVSVVLADSDHRLADLPGVADLSVDGERTIFTVADGSLAAVMNELARHSPSALVSTPPSLEDIFLRHYGPSAARESEPVR